jgi:hypothetical protein
MVEVLAGGILTVLGVAFCLLFVAALCIIALDGW